MTIVWAFSINVLIILNSLCLLFDCHLSPCVFPEGSESITRESVLSGLTSVSSMVPIARFSEEEKKVSVIKAPHYEGIGPVDESGIPIAIRTVSSHANKRLTKSVTCLRRWYVIGLMRGDYFQLSAAFHPQIKALPHIPPSLAAFFLKDSGRNYWYSCTVQFYSAFFAAVIMQMSPLWD